MNEVWKKDAETEKAWQALVRLLPIELVNDVQFGTALMHLVECAVRSPAADRPVENSEFDIEAYIRGLKYGDGTDDHAQTLVAGNLRRLYQVLVPSFPVENSKPTATDYACPDCHADRVLADRTDTKGICAECGWSGALQEDGELRGSLDEIFRSVQFAADVGTLLSHMGKLRAEISRLREVNTNLVAANKDRISEFTAAEAEVSRLREKECRCHESL